MNIGIQSGLLDQKHVDAMGQAVWLYMWLVKSQTKRNGGTFVLGGIPLSYKEIARRSGYKERLVRFWLDRLRRFHYVAVSYLNYRMLKIEITLAKKWTPKQGELYSDEVKKKRAKAIAADRPVTELRQSKDLTQLRQPSRQETVRGVTENCHSKQMCSLSNIKAPPPSAESVLSIESREPEEKTDSAKNPPIDYIAKAAFNRFVDAYPNPIELNELHTEQKFYEVGGDVMIDEILSGLTKWKASQSWEDSNFVPLAKNFLRYKKWLIDPPTIQRNGNGNGHITAERSRAITERNIETLLGKHAH